MRMRYLNDKCFMLSARFAISTCTARYGRYISVRQVTGTRTPATGRFRQKSTVGGRLKKKSTVGGRLKKKSTVGGRLKKKSTVVGRLREKSIVDGRLRKKKGRRRGKEKKKEEGKKEYLALAPSSPTCHRLRAVAARGRFFSPAGRRSLPVRRRRPRVACVRSPAAAAGIAFSPV
ncbi:hypothetical protein BHE74_00035555 [Ensete ventricosum]|nr:hypothetical protein BHE74_00035555 [Ensete ventricosum]